MVLKTLGIVFGVKFLISVILAFITLSFHQDIYVDTFNFEICLLLADLKEKLVIKKMYPVTALFTDINQIEIDWDNEATLTKLRRIEMEKEE